MRARAQAPLILAMLAVAVAAACADKLTTPATGTHGSVSLLSPANGALITQNNSTIGCPAHADRGFGFRLAFDWEDVVGADAYFVRLKRTGALFPAVDHSVLESSLEQVWCNAFVSDANLTNWVWSVAAVTNVEGSTALDTIWSEERTYGFHPCRHLNGTSCSAPAVIAGGEIQD